MTDEPGPDPSQGPGPGASPSAPWSSPAVATSPNRGGLILGAVLIVVGLVLLADRYLGFDLGRYGWPLFVIVPGVVLLVVGLGAPVREGAGLAVAGTITTVTGLVLAFQNATGLWATWAYAWALVGPAASGLGLTLYGLVRDVPALRREGLRALGVGLGLFVAFGLFFEGFIGLSGDPFLRNANYLPLVLIGGGIAVLAWGMVRGRRA
ncbi:MAG TPA: hypothetical protein VFV72_10105 [Candidatus Limnocylindrales bacterium]|nr:hypothetical protein [Candidatus Limnocylindrales bacterium]